MIVANQGGFLQDLGIEPFDNTLNDSAKTSCSESQAKNSEVEYV